MGWGIPRASTSVGPPIWANYGATVRVAGVCDGRIIVAKAQPPPPPEPRAIKRTACYLNNFVQTNQKESNTMESAPGVTFGRASKEGGNSGRLFFTQRGFCSWGLLLCI